LEDDSVRETEQRSGGDRCETNVETGEDQRQSWETESVDALQLRRSERRVQAWVQEAWVQGYNEDNDEQQSIQEGLEDQHQSPNGEGELPTLQEAPQNSNQRDDPDVPSRRNEPTVDPNYVFNDSHDSDEETELSDDGEDSEIVVQFDSDNPIQCGICEEWFPNVDALASHHEQRTCFT
jgi:hypothetical protein